MFERTAKYRKIKTLRVLFMYDYEDFSIFQSFSQKRLALFTIIRHHYQRTT